MKTTNNLKTLVLLAFLSLAFAAGCTKNDGITGPNSMNQQVSFQISQQAGYYGGTQFLFNPSADVKVSQLICRFEAQQFADTINFPNPNYVYSKDTVYIISEYTGIENGQLWKFSFAGSVNNSNYNTTINYTAQ